MAGYCSSQAALQAAFSPEVRLCCAVAPTQERLTGYKCRMAAAQALSVSEDRREAVGKQLAQVGAALEDAFGGAQDVEGALIGDAVFIVQTRPQP